MGLTLLISNYSARPERCYSLILLNKYVLSICARGGAIILCMCVCVCTIQLSRRTARKFCGPSRIDIASPDRLIIAIGARRAVILCIKIVVNMSDFEEFEKQLSENRQGELICVRRLA